MTKTSPNPTTLYILCGLPGSRKSSLATQLLLREPTALLLSSDNIRAMIRPIDSGNYDNFLEDRVRGVIENFARGCLQFGRSVIIDATNLEREKRLTQAGWARTAGARIEGHYMKLSPEESVRRCAKWIPQASIERLTARLEEPIQEDFDELFVHDAEKEEPKTKAKSKDRRKRA